MEYSITDYIKPSEIDFEDLINYLYDVIDKKIRNKWLKVLLIRIRNDKEMISAFYKCPSSLNHHHNYLFGNLQHTISQLQLIDTLEHNYSNRSCLNLDLVRTGIICADIGKTKIYEIHNNIPRNNPKYALKGHLLISIEIIKKHIKNIRDFPATLENKLIHIIQSHHGKKDYGAIIEPRIPEAEIVFITDMLDSRYNFYNNKE